MITPYDIQINRRFKDVVITAENIELYCKHPEMLYPIELTGEFLQSVGVEKDDKFKNVWRLGKIEIIYSSGRFRILHLGIFLKELRHVHEFQGLIFGLIGKITEEEQVYFSFEIPADTLKDGDKLRFTGYGTNRKKRL